MTRGYPRIWNSYEEKKKSLKEDTPRVIGWHGGWPEWVPRSEGYANQQIDGVLTLSTFFEMTLERPVTFG
jgi:hypothetical protein